MGEQAHGREWLYLSPRTASLGPDSQASVLGLQPLYLGFSCCKIEGEARLEKDK